MASGTERIEVTLPSGQTYLVGYDVTIILGNIYVRMLKIIITY